MSQEKDIFKAGSTTYYWSSKFFPKDVRDDVFKLYSFVRVVDDMVDEDPQRVDEFKKIVKKWKSAKKLLLKKQMPRIDNHTTNDLIIFNISYVIYRYDCDPEWVDSFLKSMQMDIDKRKYKNLDETLDYIYGSAEVIGLFMARILRLPITPYESAKLQGRAMQMINFIRDINEDNQLGRCYFPSASLKRYGLADLKKTTVAKNKQGFKDFINEQIQLYELWQGEASKGFGYIPKRLRIPIQTAVDMYNWTADEIKKDPLVVFEKKVKPTKQQVLKQAAKNILKA